LLGDFRPSVLDRLTVRGRVLLLAGGAEMFADRVITVPVFGGPRRSGLPHDEHSFVPVDTFGRVSGAEHVFATGDVTAGVLADRIPVPGPPVSDDEQHEAVARSRCCWPTATSAGATTRPLNALDAADALEGALPPEYEAKRREWNAEHRLAQK
jgi:hypothetical protein